jgi:hypothetical protein
MNAQRAESPGSAPPAATRNQPQMTEVPGKIPYPTTVGLLASELRTMGELVSGGARARVE